MTIERHFNSEPWFVVKADSMAEQPHLTRFRTKEKALEYAKEWVIKEGAIYHVFKAERVASVHPQEPKVYEE